MAYMRLGDLLVASGTITGQQLERALALQKETKQRLGDVLIQNGFITEAQLIDALRVQLGVDFVDLTAISIPVELAQYVPRNIAKKYCVVPVKLVRNSLYLAMSDPLDFVAQDEVKTASRKRIIPMIATRKAVGKYKVDVAEERVHDIDPDIKVTTYKTFFGPETQDSFDFTQFDYVVDAIDTVTGKLALVMKCKEAGVPIICSMGAGNKMDPTRFEVTDIYKTSVCPLAKVMRTECRKRRIKHLKVVYSKEPAMTPIEDDSISCKQHCICPPGTQRKCTIRRSVPGSNAFVPSVAGLIIGGEVVKDLVGFVPLKG